MVDLQLIRPSAIRLYFSIIFFSFFLSFQSINPFDSCATHRKCLVYTHTIRFINHAMVTMKSKQRKKIRSVYPIKKIQVPTSLINQPGFFLPFFFPLSSLVVYVGIQREKKESILSSGTYTRKRGERERRKKTP